MTTWTAPQASPAPLDWTPPQQPLEWRDGVAVSTWLRSVLHPRRGGIATGVRPLASVEEAWAGLRRGVWSEDAALRGRGTPSRVWELVTSALAAERATGLRLLDSAHRVGAASEDRTLVEACRARFEYLSGPAHDWLADFLVATHGLVEGCRRILGGLHVELPYVGVGVSGRLRELLVLADEPTYAQARDALLEVRDRKAAEHTGGLRADLFWATTFLLPVGPESGEEERAAHRAALRYTGRFGNVDVHASGLAAGDLGTLEKFLGANDRVRWEFFGTSGGRIHLASVLDIAGAAAGPVLAAMKPSYPFEDHAHHNGVWCSLLAHIDDDAAREVLQRERQAGHPWATLGPLTDPGSFEPARDPSTGATVPEGVPCDYTPPAAAHPVPLDPPVPVEPALRWREAEREAAERLGVSEDTVTWDGVPIGRCGTAQVTAWLEHREHWALPTTLPMLALAPLWTHERLFALGFEQHYYWVRSAMPLLLVRHGVGHVAPLLAAFADPPSVEAALQAAQPVGHVALTAPVVRAFAGKKLRRPARSWLLRHPRHAAAGAVALWSATPKDAAVGRVLRYLDAQGHRPLLLAQAGERAADLVTLLEQDPVTTSKLPRYVTDTPLPPLIAAIEGGSAHAPGAGGAVAGSAGGAVADAGAVEHLLARLAVCDADEVHPAVLAARDTWTARSRAAFALELFERWLTAGAPAADGWCMQAVGLIGDDAGARRLASLAKQWPGQGASARAQAALDALRHRGTDAALIELNLLAEKSRFPVFKSVAGQHIEAIADLRGLTSDELADRLVPTLGLDDDSGTVDTDAGTFRIVFDHQLLPVVRDAAGRIHADLPKPARGEDKQRHKKAKDRITALRREARASASLHVSRLERAMCAGRRIPAAIFVDRFATHPWMSHLAHRLVWGVFAGPADASAARVAGEGSVAGPSPVTATRTAEQVLVATVRVAEDGTLADVADEPVTLPPGATVGVLHPLEFPEGTLTGWAEVFADYELLQPFEQLGRPAHHITDGERSARAIDRFEGRKVTYAVLRGLERHGWTRWYDASVQMAKPIGGGVHAVLNTDPGWHASDTVDSAPPQTVADLVLGRAGDRTFGTLPPVVFSELIHDLRVVT
ncbi:DUF4132 domain-containing protein [Dactylosporangium sp. NPDC005555]|uniref:DUF4132 domain-containing protein n=1 Tax=Dactylosporangium sp. NPDC005555 TaxID=3154889 RepID=UPI0033A27CBD